MREVKGLPEWARVSDERREHTARVAALLAQWAVAMGVSEHERARWERAAWLHDSLKDAPLDELAPYAPPHFPPKTWHAAAAAALAASHGESDRGVLDAVRYHSLGYALWDDVGRMLYLADFLEPGADHPESVAELRSRVPLERDLVLLEVARRRITYHLARGNLIPKETWEFWNRLVGDGSSSPR